MKDTPVFRSAFFCRFCYNTRIHFLCLNKKLGCRSILLYARVKKNVTLCQKKPEKKEANNMIGNKTNKTIFFLVVFSSIPNFRLSDDFSSSESSYRYHRHANTMKSTSSP